MKTKKNKTGFVIAGFFCFCISAFICMNTSCSNLYHDFHEKNSSGTDNTPNSTSSVDMIKVDGGTFAMGNDTDSETFNPEHTVTVLSFYIGKYEVSQGEYAAVMGSIPKFCSSTYGLGEDYPVYDVTWYNAVSFCNALSEKDGYDKVYTISGTAVSADFTKNGYRLPTEAEWEFAARGGNGRKRYTYAGSNTIDDVAWYRTNACNVGSNSSAYGTHIVGTKAANELGLHDMSGNVSEWCGDWYGPYPSDAQTDFAGPSSGSHRVLRGGSWYFIASTCTVDDRMYMSPFDSSFDVGFRVARNSSTVPVTGVSLNKSTASVTTSGILQLTATVTPADAANQAVTWTSSAPAVATVSTSGLVTGVAAGTATITVRTDDGGYTASCVVTVTSGLSVSLEMVSVTGGTFNNGTTDMTVSDFYIGKYEVTQGQYVTVMGNNLVSSSGPRGYGDDYPVYYVTWYDAVAFCNALSVKEGYDSVYTIDYTVGSDSNNTNSSDTLKYMVTADYTKNGYRLPTEAEGEFSARGGNSSNGYTYSGSNIIGDVAWYYDNSDLSTHTVGEKAANELGLYDMSGNVWEWCWDWCSSSYSYPSSSAQTDYTGPTTGSYRVLRGGSWYSGASDCTVSNRYGYTPSYGRSWFGLRVARNSSAVSVTGVTLDQTTASIATGGTLQLSATVTPADAANQAMTWASSNTNVATVSTSGLVTGVATGAATITVATDDGGYTAECGITVSSQFSWSLEKYSASFTERNAHQYIVFDDKMWILGGNTKNGCTNDVWCSSDGVDWTEVTDSAPWAIRSNHQCIVFDDKMWIIGGYFYSPNSTNGGSLNDVWCSSDGVNWTEVTDSAPWAPRDGHQCIVYDDKIWILGGSHFRYYSGGGTATTYYNDVWYSSDGENWTEVTDSAPWAIRSGHQCVVFDNKMWLIGGSTGSTSSNTFYNDVWCSSDGMNWTKVTNSASWSGRFLHQCVIFNHGIWLVGGYTSSAPYNNDVWRSSDGENWNRVSVDYTWNARNGQKCVVFDNKIWLTGGYYGLIDYNDIWYGQ
jgi:formylglycine-generating enzyme required for sulfatase activity